MDEVDRKLLALLQQDATLSVAQIAERVGLSPTPCWRRIQKMEQAGVIARRVALVSPEAVGLGLTVLVEIEAPEHSADWLAGFARAIEAMPAVMDAWRMAGEIDYVLRVAVADMAEFDEFYKNLIASVSLKNVTSRFAMERVKSTTAYPLHGKVFRDRTRPDDAE